MRFKLTLAVNKRVFGNVLPINYQFESSAVVYKILSRASKEYSEWLHENGFVLENGKRFKLFTFSPLKIEKRRILKESQRLCIFSDTVEWQISFLPEKSTEKFIQGLFSQQTFEIGDRQSRVQFQVQNIEVLPSPAFTEEMEFSAMSPIFIKYNNPDGPASHLPPTDERAKSIVKDSLLNKYEVFYGKPFATDFNFDIEAQNEPKRKLITIKSGTPEETSIACYLCQFKMKAPMELMKIAYESGIGNENSQGFGCLRVK